MTSPGYVRVDENFYPIRDIRLIKGGIEVWIECRGPYPKATGPMRLFTTDGEAVTENARGSTSIVTIPAFSEVDTLKMSWRLNIGTIQPVKVTYQ